MDITIEKFDALGDFLTDEVYDVQFVQLPQGVSGITAEDINLRCNGFTIPDSEVNFMAVTHRTFSKEQPTHRTNIKDVTMSMIETATPKTIPFILDWQNRCAKKGTNYVYPPEQRQADIMVYLKKNDRTVAWVYNLKKCQIVTKGDIQLSDGSSPGAIKPSISLKVMQILEGPSVGELR